MKVLWKIVVLLVIIVLVLYMPVLRESYRDLINSDDPEPLDCIEELVFDYETEPEPRIMFYGLELQPGGCFQIYVEGLTDRDEIRVESTFTTEEPEFYAYMDGEAALVPVSCRTGEGEYSLVLMVYRDGELKKEREETLRVMTKEFQKQYLTVSKVQQSLKTNESLKYDQFHTERAKAVTSDIPLWEGTFIKPVEGKITTEYGMIRYVNKAESTRHAAIDIAAPKGTPVMAANGGIVRLSMPLYLNGNTVILDHGFSVFSGYGHLDRLLVTEGEKVKKGDIIGEVGSTGYSTGPHLHWTITVGGVYINPETFMEKEPFSPNLIPSKANFSN